MVVSLVVNFLNDGIKKIDHFDKFCCHISQILKIVELAESIVATGAMLISFNKLASTARGISMRILQ